MARTSYVPVTSFKPSQYESYTSYILGHASAAYKPLVKSKSVHNLTFPHKSDPGLTNSLNFR